MPAVQLGKALDEDALEEMHDIAKAKWREFFELAEAEITLCRERGEILGKYRASEELAKLRQELICHFDGADVCQTRQLESIFNFSGLVLKGRWS